MKPLDEAMRRAGDADIKIESGIPIKAVRKSRKLIEAMRPMNVGDSFYVDIPDATAKAIARVFARHRRAADHLAYKIAYRREHDGIRIWRTR